MRKKVSIITKHAPINYGSILQCIAMQRILRIHGYDSEIIDYIRPDSIGINGEKTALLSKPKWNNNVLLRYLYLSIRIPQTLLADIVFGSQRKKYLNLTRRYRGLNELIENKPIGDIYMTGSDQVWSKHGEGEFDLAYFLAFCDKSDLKVAYAASMGNCDKKTIIESELKKYLKEYHSITVRENVAKELLSSIGIESHVVLDPTLLINRDEWIRLIGADRRKKAYVLLYQIHVDTKTTDIARSVSRRLRIPVIRICTRIDQALKGGKGCILPSVRKFVSLFAGAAYVVTDSFHGTAFAINFNIPFVTSLSDDGSDVTRQKSVLSLVALENRIVSEDTEIIWNDIDWQEVNNILDIKRMTSLNSLLEMLER